jgi:hypothetical protein
MRFLQNKMRANRVIGGKLGKNFRVGNKRGALVIGNEKKNSQ